MNKRLLHTPEGVRDIYGSEYAAKVSLQEQLLNKFRLYGYEDIQTPTFEFFDIFSSNIGTVPSKDLFKFFDKEGNTLVLRPDFTPSIARCAAKYYMDETLPVRFCYEGNTFTNGSDLQGRLKESTQIGVELINDASIDADAEMIALMIESLQSVGLRDFQITIGHVEFFKGLCGECNIDPDTELEIRDYISNKNYFGAQSIMEAYRIDKDVQDKVLKVTELFGSIETIGEAKMIVKNERSLQALSRLESIYEILRSQGMERFLTFDLGMLSKYHYYTGVIFRAYTYGSGDSIVKGGRYDNLLSAFGKDAPAIGFAVVADDLYLTMQRQGIVSKEDRRSVLLLYKEEDRKKAYEKAKELRSSGIRTVLIQKDPKRDTADYQAHALAFSYEIMEI